MKAKRIEAILSLTFILLLIFACQQPSKKDSGSDVTESDSGKMKKTAGFEDLFDSTSNSIPVFYNMYLTVELSSLFEETEVAFNSDYINPDANMTNYLTSYKKALNVGVYAVDLSYVKAFEEYEYAGKYFSAMHKLAEGLGIPDDFFYDAAKRFERNIANKDSLAYIANEIYNITDNYLKENQRINTAGMIVIGGWLEAMYIACKIYKESNNNMIILDKIADQKSSLPEIIKLVDISNEKNEYILDLIKNLNQLKEPFSQLAVNLNNADASGKYFNGMYNQISELRKEITK